MPFITGACCVYATSLFEVLKMAVDDVSQCRQRRVGSLLAFLDNSVVSINKNLTMCCDVKRRTKIIIRPGGTILCTREVHKLNSVHWFNKTNGL